MGSSPNDSLGDEEALLLMYAEALSGGFIES
jgi:hypothetical protein